MRLTGVEAEGKLEAQKDSSRWKLIGKLPVIQNYGLFASPLAFLPMFGPGVQPGFYQGCVAVLFKCSNFELLMVHVKATAV